MLKEFVWKTFENTGEVDVYMFLREIEQIDKMLDNKNVMPDAIV